MKARDVVAGWPRGRSTVVRQPHMGMFGPVQDYLLNEWYHERQQAMVTAYFEEWRLGVVVRRDEMREMIDGMFRSLVDFL